MEPMNLGSPAHSPIGLSQAPQWPGSLGFQAPHQSNLSHSTPTTPGGFLPGYLMGDHSQQQMPTSRLMTPQKGSHQTSTPQSGLFGATPQPHTPSNQGFLTPTTSNIRTPAEKAGGPPTSGLFSTPKAVSANKSAAMMATPRAAMGGTPVPSTPQLSFGSTSMMHNTSVREEIFNSSNMSQACHTDNTWITVFGFPPSASSFILSQFSQYGTILHHHMPPNGNWMHIKYQTKMQAQKAIGKSNRVIGGSIMIGVVPCTDPNVEDSVTTMNKSYADPTSAFVDKDASVTTLNSSLGGARLNSSIRPLTQSFKTGDLDISVKASTPNRNSGLVGKAMEYIFGW